ncbi:MAG: hypothetical protein JXD22_03685, partial [Sedimentisphaerales bacterium]|nr:hypothetical protein [Sedimentisphaerales bacterium]
DLTAELAAREIQTIHREQAERDSKLTSLYRQLTQQAIWGDTRRADLDQLLQAGIEIKFFSVPTDSADKFKAKFVTTLSTNGPKAIVAVVNPEATAGLPEEAEPLLFPNQDNPSLRDEAAKIDDDRKKAQQRLAQLANLAPKIKKRIAELEQEANYSLACSSALADEDLFALQGWIPAEKGELLPGKLKENSIDAGLQIMEPTEDDQPPTLIHYPAWTRPIEGLFKMLGTVAGYREFDVAIPFMIALPVFAAILIGDGGYGAFLLLLLLLGYKKASKALGPQFTQLLIIVGAVSLIWGFLCGSFFGFTLYKPPIPVNMSDQSRFMMMKISFFMGAIHLSIAQFWQAFKMFPDLRFLNNLGWGIFVWGMLGVVQMFVLGGEMSWSAPWPYCLIVGAFLAILFNCPSRNVFKMVALGLANFPLSMLSAFSDVISYVRLMAVGLASSVLAGSFNELALDSGSWLIAVPTLVFGHGLNIGLALIALFAHGVRLNMLEFSNNLGMQWTGYSFKPFTKKLIQE